jgi:hypothetical protein
MSTHSIRVPPTDIPFPEPLPRSTYTPLPDVPEARRFPSAEESLDRINHRLGWILAILLVPFIVGTVCAVLVFLTVLFGVGR